MELLFRIEGLGILRIMENQLEKMGNSMEAGFWVYMVPHGFTVWGWGLGL